MARLLWLLPNPRRRCVTLISGPGGGCALSPGNNGSAAALVLQSCDAAVSAGTWRREPPAAYMAPGGSRTVPHLPLLCQMPSSPHSDWLLSRPNELHNPLNRRIRTRMSGGVGGEEPRGSPYPDFEHDPDPKGGVSEKRAPVFPRDKRETRLHEDHVQTIS
jgi:hypothetical protein